MLLTHVCMFMEKLKKNSMDGRLPWPISQMGIWGPKATLQQLDACGGLAYCREPRAVQLPCTPSLTLLPPFPRCSRVRWGTDLRHPS